MRADPSYKAHLFRRDASPVYVSQSNPGAQELVTLLAQCTYDLATCSQPPVWRDNGSGRGPPSHSQRSNKKRSILAASRPFFSPAGASPATPGTPGVGDDSRRNSSGASSLGGHSVRSASGEGSPHLRPPSPLATVVEAPLPAGGGCSRGARDGIAKKQKTTTAKLAANCH